MPFCMKPAPFQTRSMGCATPLVLVQRTLTVWVPAGQRRQAAVEAAEAVGALVRAELRREPRRAAVAGEVDRLHPAIAAEGDAAQRPPAFRPPPWRHRSGW